MIMTRISTDHLDQKVLTPMISHFLRTYSTVSSLKSLRVSLMKNTDHHFYFIDPTLNSSFSVQTVLVLFY